jgi:hypothetical protein
VELAVILELIATGAIVGGLVFAGLELRASRRQRRHEAQVLLLHSFEGPDFTRSMTAAMSLPDGISKAELQARSDGMDHLVWYWLGMMESIGMLVFERELGLRLVSGTISGPILITWRKLGRYVADVRAEMQRESFNEWFQWLAERVAALELAEGRSPAHVREANWKP